jgi:hypothetical protein
LVGLGYSLFWVVVQLIGSTVMLVRALAGSRSSARYPDSVLIHHLVDTVYTIERAHQQWTELEVKRAVIANLEAMARCVETDLPRQLATGDVSTDIWLNDRAAQIAAALRSLKKWVLTPMLDTRTQLCERLLQTFAQILSGDWDALERAVPERVSRPARIRSVFGATLRLVRLVVVALLPVSALWGYQVVTQTELPLPWSSLWLPTIGWAVLTLLILLDPQLGSKTTVMKDWLPMFGLPKPGGGAGGEH